jgi:hypothetical protein
MMRITPALALLLVAQPLWAEAITATLVKVMRQVEVQRNGSDWEPAQENTTLSGGDKIHTGFKATATVRFADGTNLEIMPMTLILLQKMEESGNTVKGRVWLRLGEVKAQVGRKGGAKSDFEVRTPTATASVRGTRIETIGYTPGLGTYITMGSEGLLAFQTVWGRVFLGATDSSQQRNESTQGPPTGAETDFHMANTDIGPYGMTTREYQDIEETGVPKTSPETQGGSSSASIPIGTPTNVSNVFIRIPNLP